MTETSRDRRVPVMCAVIGLLVAGAVAGWAAPSGGVQPAPIGARSGQLAANGLLADAIGSTWSCAGATSPAGAAPGEVILSDAGTSRARTDVDLVTSTGWSRKIHLVLSPGSERSIPEPGSGSSTWSGALVTAFGAGVSASERISTRVGTSVQPCASRASATWYFASGSVRSDASEEISLVNPYASEAVVKLSFTTDQGLEEPADFASIPVPAMGMASVDVGTHLRRRKFIATTVQAVSGRVAAFRTELVRAAPAPAGATLALGTPRASRSSWFPLAGQGAGRTETFWFYNPGNRPAPVTLSLGMGASRGPAGRASFTLGPKGVRSLVTNGEPWALPGTPYSAVVTSGAPVVVERDVVAVPSSGRRGLASLAGATVASSTWLQPALAGWAPKAGGAIRRPPGEGGGLGLPGPATGTAVWPVPDLLVGAVEAAARLVTPRAPSTPPAVAFADVLNPGRSTVKVSVEEAGGPGTAPIDTSSLGPGATAQLPVPRGYWAAPLMVRASGAVVVCIDAYSALQRPGHILAPAMEVSRG